MSLAINLATRGRPGLLMETAARTFDCIHRGDTVFMISADEDDAPTREALWRISILAGGRRIQFIPSIKPREDTIAAKWNRALTEVPYASLYLAMCDDRAIITPGFDQLFLDAAARYPDGICIVENYLDNLTFTGIQGVSAELAHLLGYIYPEHFPYWFVDHWLLDIARMIGRQSFADVTLMSAPNHGTQEMREPAWWATFYDACHVIRRAEVDRIIDVMDEPDGHRANLRLQHKKWFGNSKMVNDVVRQMSGSSPPADERYARVKAAASTFLREMVIPQLMSPDTQTTKLPSPTTAWLPSGPAFALDAA